MSRKGIRFTSGPFTRLGGHSSFDAANVAQAPAEAGIYFLYQGSRLIYIGIAWTGSSLRERLQRHLRGEEGACTQRATGFHCEPAADPLPLYGAYINVYREWSGGALPECNEDSP